MIDPAMSLIDSAYAGRLGATSLAALGPCTSIFHFSFNTFRALTFTTTALVAKYVAMNRKEQAGQVGKQSLALALTLGLLTAGALAALATPFLRLMGVGARSPLLPHALPYLKVRALVAPVVLCMMAMEGIFRGHGDTLTPLVAGAVAAAVNFSLDPILMFRLGMGVSGAAAATCIAEVIAAGIYGFLLLRRREQFGFAPPRPGPGADREEGKKKKGGAKNPLPNLSRRRARRPLRAVVGGLVQGELALLRTLLVANGAMFARSLSLMATWACATATATRLGTAHVAAHQVVLSLWLFLALVVEAPGVAAQILAGRYHSVGKTKQLQSLLRRLIIVVFTSGCTMGAMLWAGRGALPRLFATDPEVLSHCRRLLDILVLQQPVVGLTLVLESFLVGCGQFAYLARATVASAAATAGLIQLVGRGVLPGALARLLPGGGLPAAAAAPEVVHVWHCLTGFFFLRLAAVALRLRDPVRGPFKPTVIAEEEEGNSSDAGSTHMPSGTGNL